MKRFKIKLNKLAIPFSKIPIKWKLTLWSSLLLFLLFTAYNTVQYVFVEKWMIKQEETNTAQKMREILNYFLEKELAFEEADFPQIRSFLDKVNQQNQLIRVLDAEGNAIVFVSEDMPELGLEELSSLGTERAGTWHLSNNLLIMRSPLTIFQFNGTIEIVRNMEDFEKLITAIFRVMLVCGLGSVVLSGLGGRMLARQLLKPLQSMAETMRRIKEKGLHERVQVNDNKDEIATLMKMFNEMMDQVERSFQQQRQFVEDASHELRTPLAIIEGHLSLLQRWGKGDPAILEESLDVSIQELSRLKGLVQELLTLTRSEKLSLEAAPKLQNPDQTIQQLIKNIALLHPSFHFESRLDALSNVTIAVDAPHLEQILLIIMDNAVKYSGDSKLIRVSGSVQQEEASIEISDFGIGIPEEELPFVLNRFYRVDKARSGEQGGHGLGLSIAERLVKRYSGRIELQSEVYRGTKVRVTFPLANNKPRK
ncbi:HAMP domain-containing sensor histidine kinase [Paenibacillus eucommiae]|uniref:Signal transduction histidine-protein kinase ArlS n=1 Tax=Paenibacillus eucommiae TaxID=1355755 RepID=A0ABS4J9X7_9BACL|nr:HAMP domain-containing histidine kinase [Paenibacillus eucommiae]MBP1996651.1 two-component system sensor histidine kinase ArlS [Paenibacillus eucommiae]